ncbi:PBSX family phage terminase large subunit [Sphingobacterium multivorum]|nr:phage terminase large subunit [Sphingobacterium multivorum]QQT43373.1 phage terminase large subunit [Sphingobacterium multivorum]
MTVTREKITPKISTTKRKKITRTRPKIKIAPPYIPLYENTDKFIILITGGRGSGKSFNGSLFLERLSFEKGHSILFSRYTMSSAADSVIPEFQEKIDLEGTSNFFEVKKNNIINKFSKVPIMFRGIKTGSGNQTAKLKSIQGLTTFVGDEMEEWTDFDSYEKLMLSIRQKGIQNRIILIMNPTDDSHFVYEQYIKNTHKIVTIDGVDVQISTHPNVLHIHTSYLDNLENLADNFLERIEQIKQESIRQATDALGKFDRAKFQMTKYANVVIGRWADIKEGVILPKTEEGEFDEYLPYCYGQDYGFSVDPDTLIRVAVDRKKMRIYVDEEYCDKKDLGTNELIEINKSRIKHPNDLIVGDSSEDRLIADIKKLGKLNIIECWKAPGSVAASLLKMKDYTIVYTSRSNNIRTELKNYIWNDKKAGIPIDKWNHTIDAIRYAFDRLTSKDPDARRKTTNAVSKLKTGPAKRRVKR